MNLIKDDRTLRLDDFELAANEALGLYAGLLESVEEPDLQGLLTETVAGQSSLLEKILDTRRALGELPQAGDPERSHFDAFGARLRALVLPGDAAEHYVDSLIEAARNVAVELDQALALALDPKLERLLREFADANTRFETALHELE